MLKNLKLIFRANIYDAPRIYIPGQPFEPIILRPDMIYYGLTDNPDLLMAYAGLKRLDLPIHRELPGLEYWIFGHNMRLHKERYNVRVFAIAELAKVAKQCSLPLPF
jgi:hypothetical protein